MKIHNVVIPVFLFLFVSAFAADKTEGIVGGYTPIKNLGDPHVVEIAEFAVTQYGKQSGKKLSLVKIIKGESQVVNGINYRLTLTANDGSHTQSYVAVVYEKQNFKKLTSFTPIKEKGMLGAYTPIKNLSDPHVVEIAEFAVTQYGKQSGKKLSLVKIIKGVSQVVNGINYRLTLTANDGSHTQSYVAVVYEKQNVKKLTSFKSQGVFLGGWTPIKNLHDPHVVEIAQFAVTQYDKQSGDNLSLVEIVKGYTQVVAGTNYRLVLTGKHGFHTQNYEAVVWEKPWEHFRNLTSFNPLLG